MGKAADFGVEFVQWRDAIGDFILALGGCEHWTHEFVRHFAPAMVQETAASLELVPRAALARAAALEVTKDPELRRRIEVAFARLAELAPVRALVVQHAPVFGVYADRATGRLVRRSGAADRRTPSPYITLEQLQAHTAAADWLVEELNQLHAEARRRWGPAAG